MENTDLNILIVEDNLSFSLELEMLIDEMGYQLVDSVDNSERALEIIHSKMPDLILMDIDINGNLSGTQVGEKIKHLDIPIIFTTSFDDESHYKDAQDSNIIGYLIKPISKFSLKTNIDMAIKNIASKKMKKEKEKVDDLLQNILPERTLRDLKEKGTTEPIKYESVSILFTDFVGFTKISENLSPSILVKELDYCYKTFDKIIDNNNLEKIKTIGDSYMAIAGLSKENTHHFQDAIKAGIELQEFIKECEKEGRPLNKMRVGIHTGPVVAGIVGTDRLAFDVWGDAVNTAKRIESYGHVGQVSISEDTYNLAKEFFLIQYRGEVNVKGKGLVKMYYL